MPKQPKKGLSYFPLDCDIFSKADELRPLLRRYKADGLAVYIHILCDVYANGYYFQPAEYEDYLFDLAEDCGVSVEKVQLVIAFMADRTLLDAFSLNKNTVFTSHGIQKRYVEAMKGRKRSVAEIRGEHWLLTEEEERELNTFYKSDASANKSEKMRDKSEKIQNKSEKITTKEQNINKHISPLIPQGETGEGKERFFAAYPKLKALDRLAPFVIDYDTLYKHFENSAFLRDRFSASWVIKNYSGIISGEYDDHESAEEQARARAEWYRARRERAEDIAEYNRRKAESVEGYSEILKEIKRLEIASAKAEASGAVNDSQDISSRLLRLRESLKQRLASVGMSENDIEPQYHCKKCSDTGYLSNGKPCDCYEKENR